MSLYFPTLSLDILGRASSGTEPLAVLESADGNRYRVIACNTVAAARGVRTGMSLQASLVLSPSLICRYRQFDDEQAALERLATWAGRFSSRISLAPPEEILMEVKGSLRLYGGMNAMLESVREGLKELGYRARMAIAPYPQAASLLVRSDQPAPVTDPETLIERLGHLPSTVLQPDERCARVLEELGIRELGDLFRLPSAGLRKRLGPELPQLLDRALGRRPDPRPCFEPPQRFRSHLDLPVPVQTSEPLLFAARRLLQELVMVLETGGAGITELCFLLQHRKGRDTRIDLSLVKPDRDSRHWLALFKERLEQTLLDREVEGIVLRAGKPVALRALSADLFEETSLDVDAEGHHLLERLQNRLGREAVQGVMLVNDHRPERAWRLAAPGEGRGGDAPKGRPLWLLREPQDLEGTHHQSWQLWGPERIESGWWDGADMARDYFLAETLLGERLWIFQDRRSQGWFLHGIFA